MSIVCYQPEQLGPSLSVMAFNLKGEIYTCERQRIKTVYNRILTINLTIVENSLIYFKVGSNSIFIRDFKVAGHEGWDLM